MFWRLASLMTAVALFLTGCGDEYTSTLKPKGPVAREQLYLMKLSLGIMIFVIVVVFAIYIYVLIKFRARKDQTGIPKQVEGNHVLEIVWTVIPIILLLILAIPTVQYTFKHSADLRDNKDAVQVKVTGHQFWWQFEYPGLGINTAQDLVIPAGKKIAFEITTTDVNHSFWVPSLGGKMDASAGVTNVLYLQADEPGVFQGQCAELCGASHALMYFKVIAKTQSEFDAWANGMKAQKTTPTSAAKGEQLFKDNCLACHAVNVAGPGLGPNLNGFANRERIAGILERGDKNDDNLYKWIHDPQNVKPGTKMPQVQENGQPLSKEKINEIIKYLNTLK